MFGLALLLSFLATELGFLQRIVSTTSLTLREWLVCLALALSVLVVEEAIKFVLTRRGTQAETQSSAQAAPQARPQVA